jgi:hypothetical protein
VENEHSELDAPYRTLGRRLAGIRREAGLTQAQLVARLSGTNRGWQQAVHKARPVWRDKAMARLDTWAAEHGLPPEPFIRMKQAVITLFAEMERRGELE